jgi:hypothetical protein
MHDGEIWNLRPNGSMNFLACHSSFIIGEGAPNAAFEYSAKSVLPALAQWCVLRILFSNYRTPRLSLLRSEFFCPTSNCVPNWQSMNKEALGNFKGLSQDGERGDLF